MRINASGYVGIATTNPTATLFVARGGGADGTAVFCGTNAYSHFNYSTSENTYIRGGKTGAIVHLNDSHNGNVILAAGGGNVGIGTASPTYLLDLSGRLGFSAMQTAPSSLAPYSWLYK